MLGNRRSTCCCVGGPLSICDGMGGTDVRMCSPMSSIHVTAESGAARGDHTRISLPRCRSSEIVCRLAPAASFSPRSATIVGVTSNVLVVMPALMSYECYDGHRTTGLLTVVRAARSYATTTLTQREVCPTTGRENNSPTSGCRNDPKLTRLPTCTPCVHMRAHVPVSSPS